MEGKKKGWKGGRRTIWGDKIRRGKDEREERVKKARGQCPDTERGFYVRGATETDP